MSTINYKLDCSKLSALMFLIQFSLLNNYIFRDKDNLCNEHTE